MEPLTCARHPSTETYLRCSSCDTPICPECWVDAVVGYHCPACSAARTEAGEAAARRIGAAAGARRTGWRSPTTPPAAGERLPFPLAAKAAAVGLGAAVLGGLLLGPVLAQGVFFLITAGAIGWGVARAVYWATDEVSSPFVRAVALTMAGFTVAIGMATAQLPTTPSGIVFLAYPAAVYGGWIVVRQR